ncbi:protein CIST1-like [Hoplias malabaricus]|uniref:protein CIST1-like n=1 Tax=Hoplias malabaricus TaxID=27720 RepID=UPI0034631E49
MANMLHAITILIIASRASLVQTHTVSNQTSSPESSTYSPVSSTTLTTNETVTETHGSERVSPSSTTQTSALTSAVGSTTLNRTETETPPSKSPETSSNTTMSGQQSGSTTSSRQGHSTLSEETTTEVLKNYSSGITTLKTTNVNSPETSLLPTRQPNTTASAQTVNIVHSTVSQASGGNSLARNPGLVAILCIFFIVLALVLVVVIIKFITTFRKPRFERLDDLPMGKMSEEAPFARYPPK